MTNSIKKQAREFVAANAGLKRQEYIDAFIALGVKPNTASMYHYWLVTQSKKSAVPSVAETVTVEEDNLVVSQSKPTRDAKGRFVKRS